jgi:Ca2+/Na+ antiporter
MPIFNIKIDQIDRKIQSLSFIKATAWVILGISSLFSAYDLTLTQNEEYWFSTVIKFGMAVAYLLAGIFFQKDQKRNIVLLMIVILVDAVVSIQPSIGVFDILMLLFDLIFYWLILGFLKQNKQ